MRAVRPLLQRCGLPIAGLVAVLHRQDAPGMALGNFYYEAAAEIPNKANGQSADETAQSLHH